MGQEQGKNKVEEGKGKEGRGERVRQKVKASVESGWVRAKTWFSQLSFWKKIIIIFTLNTLILLILTDSIMLVLFGKISDDIISISNAQKQQYNQVSNTQIAAATSKMTLSKIDRYANILHQLTATYYYFTANPNLYTSLQTQNPPLPLLTTSFTNISYTQPGLYYLTPLSTFTPLPYLDELLPKLIPSQVSPQIIKRINIFVQNKINPNDLTARTIPATNDFTIPSASEMTKRFQGILESNFTISLPYIDSLTTSSSKDNLLALRTVLVGNTSNIYMQVEVLQQNIIPSLTNIYYFSSALIVFAVKVGSSYTFLTASLPAPFLPLLPIFYPIGTSRITVQGVDYVSASVGLANRFTLGKYSTVTNSTNDPVRCIVLVKAQETQSPAIQIQQFLNKQSNVLRGVVFLWSVLILLSTVALATVVGNYIFSNLKMLSTKMQQYIREPNKFHLIVIELKQLQLKGILKKLSDNLIGIIEKIEVRKRERKDRINQNYHPLSVGEEKFQERQQLNDYQVIEEIKEEVRVRVEQMRKEKEEKEREEREKDKEKNFLKVPEVEKKAD